MLRAFDGDVDGDWRTFIQFLPENDVESVVIRDLAIDHNARGSPPPPKPFGYQHSGAINFLHRAGVTVRQIEIDNVTIIDPAADGVQFGALGVIEKASVRNLKEFSRTRKRSTVCVVHQPCQLLLSDIIGQRIESEVQSQPPADSAVTISNCQVEILDLGLHHPWQAATDWLIANTTATGALYVENTMVRASNCEFRVHEGAVPLLYLPEGTAFFDCLFRVPYDAASNSVRAVAISAAQGRPALASFERRRFLIDSVRPNIQPTGPLVALPAQVAAEAEADIVIRDCWFDRRAEASVSAVNCGTAKLIGNDYGGTGAAVLVGASDGKLARVLIDGGRFDRVAGSAIGIVAGHSAAAGSALRLSGAWEGVATPVSGDPTALALAEIVSTRLMPMAALPAAGLSGDVVWLAPPRAGAPDSYRCTASSVSAAEWRLTSQAGVLRGEPGSRPALGVRDAGTQYFDTGLADAGKPIWWTGRGWVDAAGEAV